MAKKNKETKLTDQQELFCREYIKDLNATQAATRAKYSKDTAQEQGSRLLSNVMVQARLAELKEKQFKRLDIDADEILTELRKLGLSDLRQVFDENNCLKPVHTWPSEVAMCIASIEIEEIFDYINREKVWTGYTKKVKFWDKPKALELLGKHKKLFTDKVEHALSESLEALIAGSHEKKTK